ncbi:uncharacterized protein LOC114762601 [Neltuma alba]|uniref:uncharacterized protein LOC114762601 n=1 Tax=Neltuma alba TaxID=207710 RepID=UPI0010A2B3AA|nr:uncharacterized protein LOC114762601 [Prosopis alba]
MNIWFNSKNLIHVSARLEVIKMPDYITFVYGVPTDEKKMLIWNKMRDFTVNMSNSWLCLGDFNDVKAVTEKLGKLPINVRRVLNFEYMLADCELMDLGYQGSKFTWNNRRLGDEDVKERLDRAVANCEFREDFQNALVTIVDLVGSDHHLLIVDYDYRSSLVPKTFRFEVIQAEHEKFPEVVRKGWEWR